MSFLKNAVHALEKEMKGLNHGGNDASTGSLTRAERIPNLT